MTFYLHTKSLLPDGTGDCHLIRQCEHKVCPMPHHKAGLSYTASGYGERIPTVHMIRVDGRWRRVYCRIFGNSGTLFIGKKYDGTAIVRDYA